jgi:hypothetical protein
MEETIQVFRSFAEADDATVRSDLALTPEQRIEQVLKLRAAAYPDEVEQGLARVCRVVPFEWR